jgi:hypothetical protein
MTLEKYRDHRKIFLEQYRKCKENEFGFVKLDNFVIPNFDRFIWLYSIDNATSKFNLVVSSIDSKKWVVKYPRRPGDKIKIDDFRRSLFDKFPEQFDKILNTYDKNIKP